METLQLAFKVSVFAFISGLTWFPVITIRRVFVQMYGDEEKGEVHEDDLAIILESMLGFGRVELSLLFLTLEPPTKEKITFGKCL